MATKPDDDDFSFEIEDENNRAIEIAKIDKRGEDLLSGLQAKL